MIIEYFLMALALIVTISILVTVHEFGHYWVARMCNVHVIRFSIGFGTPFFSRRGLPPDTSGQLFDDDGNAVPIQTRANEPLEGTEFAIAPIPLGGYVKMLDEREGYVPDDQLHLAFNRKTVWQRIAIVAAGPIANFILAIAAYWLLFATGVTGIVPLLGDISQESAAARAGLKSGQEIVAVDGIETRTRSEVLIGLFDRMGESGEIEVTVKEPGSYDARSTYQIPIDRWLSDAEEPNPTRSLGIRFWYPHVPAVIGEVVQNERAQAAGIKTGDEVISIDGVAIRDWEHVYDIVGESPEQTLRFTVERNGSLVDLDVTPKIYQNKETGVTRGRIGAGFQSVDWPADMQRVVSYPVYTAWLPALEETWDMAAFQLKSVKKLVTAQISIANISGPFTISQVAYRTALGGFERFVGFLALLSITLGIINLLPIPVLDGGHLLYYFYEAIVGRPMPEKVQMWGLQVGMFLILGIMTIAIFNDLTRL